MFEDGTQMNQTNNTILNKDSFLISTAMYQEQIKFID